MRRKIPNTQITYTRVLPTWKNILSRYALYQYTNRMYDPIRRSMENTSRKNARAKLYSRYISRKMKPRNYNSPLYRGLRGNHGFNKSNIIRKKSFSSFTKNKNIANSYSNNKILVLNNPKNIPSVNYEYYKSEYPGESEVLVAPGTFKVTKRNGRYIHVNYYPINH